MIIARFEGDRHSFEVALMSEGFIVRARCLANGELVADRERLFRTPQGAFSYADLSAQADEAGIENSVAAVGQTHGEFAVLPGWKTEAGTADTGVSAGLIAAWSRHAEASKVLVVN